MFKFALRNVFFAHVYSPITQEYLKSSFCHIDRHCWKRTQSSKSPEGTSQVPNQHVRKNEKVEAWEARNEHMRPALQNDALACCSLEDG